MAGPYGSDGGFDDPCRAARGEVAAHCQEAERLAGAARRQADRLRAARQERIELDAALETGELADAQSIAHAKSVAQQRYRERYHRARDHGDAQAAAAEWMAEIDRLNRRARLGSAAAGDFARRRSELDARMARLELAADAARVAAEAAEQACLEARQRLALCGESLDAGAGRSRGLGAPYGAPGSIVTPFPALRVVEPGTAICGLLEGDEAVLAALGRRLAPALGSHARAMALLLELSEAVIDSALAGGALVFPPRHPFWNQFPADDARLVASALGALGNGFDGRGGWSGGQPADARQLAMAIAYAGHDARSVRQPQGATEMATLWQGTGIDATGHLAQRAPELTVEELAPLLGRRFGGLAELWDHWGSVRPLLLAPAAGPSTRPA